MTIYECKPGNMPEDIMPEAFFLEPFRSKGGRQRYRFRSPLLIIADTPEGIERNMLQHKSQCICQGVGFRSKPTNGRPELFGRYTWNGQHPRYWANPLEEQG